MIAAVPACTRTPGKARQALGLPVGEQEWVVHRYLATLVMPCPRAGVPGHLAGTALDLDQKEVSRAGDDALRGHRLPARGPSGPRARAGGLVAGDRARDGGRRAASLARPGGNITGLGVPTPEIGGKRLQLLQEFAPTVGRVAVLSDPSQPGISVELKGTEVAARALGVQLQVAEARSSGELDRAFAAIARERVAAIVVLPSTVLFASRARIAQLAAKHRMATSGWTREFPEAGCLMSYGANLPDAAQRAAYFVDKILKGAKPCRPSGGATDEVRVRHQHEDRQGARPHDPAVRVGPGGPGDRIIQSRSLRCDVRPRLGRLLLIAFGGGLLGDAELPLVPVVVVWRREPTALKEVRHASEISLVMDPARMPRGRGSVLGHGRRRRQDESGSGDQASRSGRQADWAGQSRPRLQGDVHGHRPHDRRGRQVQR